MFQWDGFSNINLTNGTTYIFATYILDAITNTVTTSIIGDSDEGYSGGVRYSTNTPGVDGTNLELDQWSYIGISGSDGTPHTYYNYKETVWDLQFQLNGH